MKTWTTSGGFTVARLLTGRSNVYLLSNGVKSILVDTGWTGDRNRLRKKLNRLGPPDLVIMTHTHFDHAGNAGMLKELFSPAFMVHESEQGYLESGSCPLPNGTVWFTRFLYSLGAEKVPGLFRVPGVPADTTFSDRFDLSAYGFNAFILHTPGHSEGSSSVVVGDEIALVGDAMTGMPGSIFPPWGSDPAAITASWGKLLATGCRLFLPAHGFGVGRSRLEASYASRLQ
jgi:glyoxylase-like metal-dependent hydrolase (beta-lactamase superfamily II)